MRSWITGFMRAHEGRRAARLVAPAVLTAILGLTAALYWPSLRFGFFWDDPPWFRRIAGHSLLEIIAPQPDFQFYRPATLLFSSLFVRGDGTFDCVALHASQIGLHLIAIALVYLLCRQLGLARSTGLAGAALFALLPFAQQAVAWGQAIGPSAVTVCLLATMNAYARWRRGGHWAYLALAGASYLLALGFQESAVPYAAVIVLLDWALVPPAQARQGALRGRQQWAPAGHILAAAAYLVVWIQAPKAAGLLGLRLSPGAAYYLSQGIAYPLLGRPEGWGGDALSGPVVLLVAAGTAVWLASALSRGGRRPLALLGAGWYVAGLLPGWAGLPSEYVYLASRMFYPAGFGAVLLWVSLLEAGRGFGRLGRAWTGLAWIAILLAGVQSALLVAGFNRMYAQGTRQMGALVDWSATSGQASALFVNFPDRFAPREPPYPIGYWGITLAAVSVDLGEFVQLARGTAPRTASLSAPELDADARAAGPYAFDLRGVSAGPEEIYHAAGDAGAVLLTRYALDGSMRLLDVGHVLRSPNAAATPLARYGTLLTLDAATLEREADEYRVALTWRCLGTAPQQATVFVHLGLAGQPPLVQADGDALGGLVPLATCRPGDVLVDRRVLPLPREPLPAGAAVLIGVYSREDGSRLEAVDAGGARLADDAWVVR